MLEMHYSTIRACRHACERWHYSGTLPTPLRCPIAVYEHGYFIGCLIFGWGATPEIGKPFNLQQQEVCELTRVALRQHETPVSRIVSIGLKMLRRACKDVRLVVSYADSLQGHVGTIYQAGNWLYLGESKTHAYRVRGKIEHPRRLGNIYGKGGQSVAWLRENVDPDAERINGGLKYKYVYPYDKALRKTLQQDALPYPCDISANGRTSTVQVEGAGSIPSMSLYSDYKDLFA